MEKFVEMFKDVLEIEELDVSHETKFRDLENWDSLSVLSVLAMINDEYDIIINRKDFETIITVGELYNHIKNK